MAAGSGLLRRAGAFALIVVLGLALAAALLPAAPALSRGEPGEGLPEISVRALPAEARETLRLIRAGGPFPYERDGIVFGNREKLLPLRPRGYYREYTVRTPGATNRGARRIVAAQSGELYYTDDHYASFRRIRE
jgi:ribonuclease T1